jgi:hypothetical protein
MEDLAAANTFAASTMQNKLQSHGVFFRPENAAA